MGFCTTRHWQMSDRLVQELIRHFWENCLYKSVGIIQQGGGISILMISMKLSSLSNTSDFPRDYLEVYPFPGNP